MNAYCDVAAGHSLHGFYHDKERGFPTEDETVLFERLCLEIFQAGLSWELVLRKRRTLNAALDGFSIDKIVTYGETDIARLLGDPGIIRNRLKVAAVIENACRIRALRDRNGGFSAWIAAQPARDKAAWVKTFGQAFKFTGGEIVGEFLMSIGYLPGAHRLSCPIHEIIALQRPPWMVRGLEIQP
jgi:DNA-3-methyladenine glycosylase I